VTLALGEPRRRAPAAAPITLLQAVPRGERMDLLVQKTTELGVARIVPLVSERSVVRPTAARARRWQTIAQEAARQSGRADLPEVTAPLPFADALPLAAASPTRLALWEEERARPLRQALTTAAATALLIGPEGGLTADEIDQARAAGFLTVTLGPRILRVETAAIVAVVLVQSATGALD
jgi:16S rRNA (uracil1498-N3)-methyltransferase